MMEKDKHKDLVSRARDLYTQMENMQKIMLDMYLWEFMDLDEQEERQRIQEEYMAP